MLRPSARRAAASYATRATNVQARSEDPGQQTLSLSHLRCHRSWDMGGPEIIAGPTPMRVLSLPGVLYRWKVQNGSAEQHVYVQIAESLTAEAFDEPLRSGIRSKGESVLRKLLERGNVPVRIKITSGGITEVGVDQRSRPCSF
jgi:hypothetical protein